MAKSFTHIAIIGLGLIGSSLARAIRAYSPEITLFGYDASKEVYEQAKILGFCHHTHEDIAHAVKNADCVFLCTPLSAYDSVLARIKDHLSEKTVVSDTGSTKRGISELFQKELPKHIIPLPAHPVAGTEHSGPQAGLSDLFIKRYCILTPPPHCPKDAVQKMTLLWKRLGSFVEIMSAQDHDYMLGAVSHLPHLVAWGLVGTVMNIENAIRQETSHDIKKNMMSYAAGGFRDFTRIAASNPLMWRDIFMKNQDHVLKFLDLFIHEMTMLKTKITDGEAQNLEKYFESTKSLRLDILARKQAGRFIATETETPEKTKHES